MTTVSGHPRDLIRDTVPVMTKLLLRTARLSLAVVRWWFALTYLLGGIGAAVAGVILLFTERAGEGGFLLLGGAVLAALGWLIHPWGLQRRVRGSRVVATRAATQ
ncbi:MAG: hypothetical protein QOE76_3730 [Frankiales bacterium]|jgi:hypothetical protein|nr:hypothetical protein [Frankiales bacterium]MDX6246007.1 hypothetical protein [Frankiales bacterium]